MQRRSDPLIGMFATQEMFRLLGLVPGVDFKAALDECEHPPPSVHWHSVPARAAGRGGDWWSSSRTWGE